MCVCVCVCVYTYIYMNVDKLTLQVFKKFIFNEKEKERDKKLIQEAHTITCHAVER